MTAAGVVVGDTHDASLVPWGRLKLLKVAVSSGEDGPTPCSRLVCSTAA